MKKGLKRALQVALIAGLVWGALAYRDLRAQANIGAGYVAHQICSCVFVAKRSHASCLPDMRPSMDRIRSELIERDGRRGVRGWIPALANRVAMHTPGRGCALE